MQEVIEKSWAAYKNREFICAKSCSGYRSRHGNQKGKQPLLGVDANDLEALI